MVGLCDGAGKTSSAGASYNLDHSRARAYCTCSTITKMHYRTKYILTQEIIHISQCFTLHYETKPPNQEIKVTMTYKSYRISRNVGMPYFLKSDDDAFKFYSDKRQNY